MPTPRVALLPGSTRTGSLHRRLARVLVDAFARHGVDAELVDLADHPMPIYHGDDEAASGVPAAARALHDRLTSFDGLVFVSPEHNGGPSALLKNAIDWVTRVDRRVFAPLLVGLAAASPGSRGAVTGLGTLRRILEHMRLDVVDGEITVAGAGDAFEEVDGRVRLVRPDDAAAVERYVEIFADELHDRAAAPSQAVG